MSPNVTGADAIKQHRNAIDQAIKAGAKHIYYTSHMGASGTSEFPPMLAHASAETYLAETGIPYTSFRNGFYVDSAIMMIKESLKTGELYLPEDGPVSWTSHSDLASAIATSMVSKSFSGITPALTSLVAIDFKEIAQAASELFGKEIKRIVVSDDKYQKGLISRGVPTERVEIIMGLFRAARNGEFRKTDPSLSEILGRKPQTMREFLKASQQ